MEAWGENFFMFCSETKQTTDLEFLQSLCGKCGLLLYVDESKTGANYMISGKTFVIDIIYGIVGNAPMKEEKIASDTLSVGSGAYHPGKEKVEDAHKTMKKINLSLMEEFWSKYFTMFTKSLWTYLKQQEYLKIYELVYELVKYDNEDTSTEKSFYGIVGKMEAAVALLEKKQLLEEFEVNYSFQDHAICLLARGRPPREFEEDVFSSHQIYAVLEENATHARLSRNRYAVEDISGVLNHLARNRMVWKVVSESIMHRVPITLTGSGEGLGVCFGGAIDRKKQKIWITPAREVEVGKSADKYRTLLLQRTESILHVIKETDIDTV
ncbi:hypothetical protein NEDG_00522 [Nematocida displodere]|uniref:Uncharacterized protein n=1 Tax=Nematocida displodere TaxID=1805483 RepID=A0A177EEG8_9MICR|nr:hypothetical protein NEDG_00522 [Nematocida displodere]